MVQKKSKNGNLFKQILFTKGIDNNTSVEVVDLSLDSATIEVIDVPPPPPPLEPQPEVKKHKGRVPGAKNRKPDEEKATYDPEYFKNYYINKGKASMSAPVKCKYCNHTLQKSKLLRHMATAKYCIELRDRLGLVYKAIVD